MISLFAEQAIAQVYTEFEKFSLWINNDNLFNSLELKNKKIKSLCIIDSMFNVESTENRDTIFIYEFDANGNAIREIGFRYNKRDYDYDLRVKQNWKLPYEITRHGADSIVKYFEIDTIEGLIDTAITFKFVYNAKRKEIEFEKTPSEFYRRYAECGVGLSVHWTIEYDELGRETAKRNLKTQTIKSTTYTPFGYSTEERDMKTNEVLSQKSTLIKKTDTFTSESDGESLTLISYLENGLIYQAVVIPNYYDPVTHILEFVYSK
jgi:hypothetical protein